MKKMMLSIAVVSTLVMSASAQLYDQAFSSTINGVISTYMTDNDTLVQCADDFTIPAGADWDVTSVTVRGFRNGTGPNMTDMTVELWSDASGPGTIIYTEDITLSGAGVTGPSNDTAVVLTLTTTQTLSPGTYWLSVYGDTPSQSEWNWLSHGADTIGAVAMLIDADDYFGTGATTWTEVTSLNVVDPDLSFQINGTGGNVGITELSSSDISVYPNPAVDVLNVEVDGADIEQVNIYNADGKFIFAAVNPSNGINVAELAAGAYIVEVSTINGYSRTQFMKK